MQLTVKFGDNSQGGIFQRPLSDYYKRVNLELAKRLLSPTQYLLSLSQIVCIFPIVPNSYCYNDPEGRGSEF